MNSDKIQVTEKKKRSEPDGIPRKRILVVDDEPIVLMMLADTLEVSGYETIIAPNGDEAEHILQGQDVDLILSDIMMPGRTGLELIHCFQEIQPAVPIIMMTGFGKVDHAIKCFKMGAADFLHKPIAAEKLLAVVKRCLRLNEPARRYLMPSTTPQIKGYKFIETLGEGNMGVVYMVESDGTNGPVMRFALKVLKLPVTSDAKTSHSLRRRFMNEAKAVFSIQHPNIIKVYDYGMDHDNMPYILMELFDGEPLDEFLMGRTVSFENKCLLLQQIAFALATVHDNDICHRDIKPANVLVDDCYTAKVMDFGIARVKDSTLTPTAHVFGTPAYLAPEAFSSARVDHRSDIFSFGSLAYELFTGKRPFDAKTVAGIAQQVCKVEPKWPSTLNIDIPPELEAELKRMLDKDPNKRQQNAFDLYEIFCQYSDHGNFDSGW